MKLLKILSFSIPFIALSVYIVSILQDLAYRIAFLYWFCSVMGFAVYVVLSHDKLKRECDAIETEMFQQENGKAIKKVLENETKTS